MDLVFDHHDLAVRRPVSDQPIGGLERDVVDIGPKRSHQLGPALDDARPAGNVVADLVRDAVGDDFEEVLAIDEVAERSPNKMK